jgi:hypothetical protein
VSPPVRLFCTGALTHAARQFSQSEKITVRGLGGLTPCRSP